MAQGRFIAYYRVSTKRQGASGLGLEAQREAVRSYLNGGRWTLVEEFTEVESGKLDERPQLRRALAACRVHRATLVVAKLDRLSRNARFLMELRDSGVQFRAVDLPEANALTVGVMALVAQQEREAISARTRAALAAAKQRGTQLGTPKNLTEAGRRRGLKASAKVRAAKATERAQDLGEVLRPLREQGHSLRDIAGRLNAMEVPTPSGRGMWAATTVARALERIGAA